MDKETRTNFEFIKDELSEIKSSIKNCESNQDGMKLQLTKLDANFTNHLIHHKEETSRNRWIFGAIMIVISVVVAIIVRVI